MRYVILDDDGRNIGGTIQREWNTLQDYREAHRTPYYAGKIRVFLMFLESELMDDITRFAAAQGQAAQRQAREEKKPVASFVSFQEIGEEDWKPLVKRTIASAVSECESIMHFLAKHRTTGDRSMDNGAEQQIEYAIELRVPDTFSDTSVMNILRTVHDYIVARVLFEWANLTCPSFAEFWQAKMQADEETLAKENHRASVSGEARIVPSW